MTETPEPVATPAADPLPDRHPSRLNQVLAWVGIVAGVVFIVAVVFFSGFIIGKHSGGDRDWGHHMKGVHMFHRGGPPPMGPRMGPMGPGGPMEPGGPGAPPPPAPTTTPRP